ncbi:MULTISPECIES: FAD-dependent oxidoreductase [unclassified Photorhabdus]|uniref:FAD-dependent oxidoreductase n=1 Tax=unclassified Photorhabdus TaxID=2620880 RepID=UPI002106911C|nr:MULTISPECIES: FAD-dependent oxidoreductase [unclassified Photorhabdus]
MVKWVTAIRENSDRVEVVTPQNSYQAKWLINCAGLHSDRIARLSGYDIGMKIIPFRGEYYVLNSERNYLVNHLIYPVPNPDFPFLGVHFTRMYNGKRDIGPNAVLAFKREGYKIYGHPRFCNTNFDVWWACVNLFCVW